MKRNHSILILLFLVFTSCSGGKTQEYQVLKCFNDEQSELINTILTKFDDQLSGQYGRTDYKQFLSDMSRMSLPPEFFVKSDLSKILNESRSQSAFRDIWTNYNGTFQLNIEGKYMKCLKAEANSDAFREILDTMAKIGGISPGLIAGAMASELTEEQVNSLPVRTFIAINLYSEFSINLFDRFNE